MSLLIYDENKNSSELEDDIYPICYDKKNKKVIFVNDKREYKTEESTDSSGVSKTEKIRINDVYKGSDLQPIPYLKKNQRSAVYISGCSGCGKSTFCAGLIDWYRILHKNPLREVFLFTRGEQNDPAFKKYENDKILKTHRGKKIEIPAFNMFHVERDFDLISKITVKNLHDSIIIFDDWESISNKFQREFIYNMIKKILEESRKLSCDVVIITHGTLQGKLTKPILFECDSYVVFPLGTPKAYRSLTENYSELNKDEVNNIYSSLSKAHDFFFYRKSFPQYYITPYEIKML